MDSGARESSIWHAWEQGKRDLFSIALPCPAALAKHNYFGRSTHGSTSILRERGPEEVKATLKVSTFSVNARSPFYVVTIRVVTFHLAAVSLGCDWFGVTVALGLFATDGLTNPSRLLYDFALSACSECLESTPAFAR